MAKYPIVMYPEEARRAGLLPPLPKRSTPRRELEHGEQVAFINWCNLHSSEVPELAEVYAIPNGGYRHKYTAARLKAEGVKAGLPDLSLDIPSRGYHGWRCEMKVAGGHIEPEQARWHLILGRRGYRVDICWSWQEAAHAVCFYLAVSPEGLGIS